MRDMSMGWPRWLAFIAFAALTWVGLASLEPDRNRLAGAAYASLAAELSSDPALSSEGAEDRSRSQKCGGGAGAGRRRWASPLPI